MREKDRSLAEPAGYIDIKRAWADKKVLLATTPTVKAVGVIVTNEHTKDSFVVHITGRTDHIRNGQFTMLPFDFTGTVPLGQAQALAEEIIAKYSEAQGIAAQTDVIQVNEDKQGKEKYTSREGLSDAVEEDYDLTMEAIKRQCFEVPIDLLVDQQKLFLGRINKS